MTTFLLSPADCRGKRAGLLLREEAAFPLAVELRAGRATLGAVFSFVSGLYFRGKLTYATRFGGVVRVIVPGRGLIDPALRIATAHVEAFAEVPVDLEVPGYLGPLERDLVRLAEEVEGPVVLLRSVATAKYVSPLSAALGDRLRFPTSFLGKGDMSRGAMLLDAVKAGEELVYGPVVMPAVRRRRARK